MITKFKFTPQGALSVRTQIHTAPEAFGKAMPRMSLHEATWNWKSKDLAAQMERSTETNLVYIFSEYPEKRSMFAATWLTDRPYVFWLSFEY